MKRFSIALIFFSSLLLPLQTFGFKPLEEIGRGFFQSFGADLQRGLLVSPYYHSYPRYPQYYPYYPPPIHYYEPRPICHTEYIDMYNEYGYIETIVRRACY